MQLDASSCWLYACPSLLNLGSNSIEAPLHSAWGQLELRPSYSPRQSGRLGPIDYRERECLSCGRPVQLLPVVPSGEAVGAVEPWPAAALCAAED